MDFILGDWFSAIRRMDKSHPVRGNTISHGDLLHFSFTKNWQKGFADDKCSRNGNIHIGSISSVYNDNSGCYNNVMYSYFCLFLLVRVSCHPLDTYRGIASA